MLQIVASLTDDSRSIIYDCNIFIIQARNNLFFLCLKQQKQRKLISQIGLA